MMVIGRGNLRKARCRPNPEKIQGAARCDRNSDLGCPREES